MNFFFDSVESGRNGKCNFVCPKHISIEAEELLDFTINGVLQYYEAEWCREILGG